MGGKSLLWPTIMTVLALAVLLSLGIWQLQRLAWKQGLLDQLRAGLKQQAADLSVSDAAQFTISSDAAALEFQPVTVKGTFAHADEAYVFHVRDGRSGFLVFTPLMVPGCQGMAGACRIWVNRGFVPQDLLAPAARAGGQIEGETAVNGIIRRPEKPGIFTPEPDKKRRVWYAASFPEGYYVEAGASPNPGGWPKGRSAQSLLASIPNRHAEYAFTWFSLAAVLTIVYGFFAVSRLHRKPR